MKTIGHLLSRDLSRKIEGITELRFMDLKDWDALGNYKVKIYG